MNPSLLRNSKSNFTVRLRNELLRRLNPPVIIIGMHRSGTSLVTRLLEACGLFLGSELEANHESIFFQNINISLLRGAGADWSRNQLFEKKLNDRKFFKQEISSMKHQIQTELFHYFFKSRLQLKFLNSQKFQWGWKDPRNSLTLPLWLEIFPNARIVHVVRNGIDSALSLFRREQTTPSELSRSNPNLNVVLCFKIWEEYVDACLKFSSRRNYCEIQYEQLLKNPNDTLENLLAFLGMRVEGSAIRQAICQIKLKTDEQQELSELREQLKAVSENSKLMHRFGYLSHD